MSLHLHNQRVSSLMMEVNGRVMIAMGVLLFGCTLVDYVSGSQDWPVLAWSGFFLVGFGRWASIFDVRQGLQAQGIPRRHMVTLITSMWIVSSLAGSLPFMLHPAIDSWSNALFEGVSGITSTGASAISFWTLSRGFLLWRAVLEWLGGIGLVVVTLLILPGLHLGSSELFRMESSEKTNPLLGRSQNVVAGVGGVYVALTLMCVLMYAGMGMGGFDAIVHGMTTVSTGGFGNHQDSFAPFRDQPGILWVAIVFMVAGSLPFGVYLLLLHEKGRLNRIPSQVVFFLTLYVGMLGFLTLQRWGLDDDAQSGIYGAFMVFTHTSFNLISVLSTTGFASEDYLQWGDFTKLLFLVAMLIGGCSGSTAGGIKIVRLQILTAVVVSESRRLANPYLVAPPVHDGQQIDRTLVYASLSLMLLWLGVSVGVALLLTLGGIDGMTAFSSSLAMVSNLGPSLGALTGPMGSYSEFGPLVKVLFCGLMILGRLEMMLVLAMIFRSLGRA